MSFTLPRVMDSHDELPEQIFGYVSVKSQGGKSCFEISEHPESSHAFHAKAKDRKTAEQALSKMGFEILEGSRLGLALLGPPGAWEELSGGTLVTKEILVTAEASTRRYVTHIDIVGKGQPQALGCGLPKSAATAVEAIVLEHPRSPLAVFPSPIPPSPPGFYLRVPDGVATGLNAPSAHAMGFRGKGIVVAMVDTGEFAHPFFAAHRYQLRQPISMVPGASRARDPVGHGTGESANIFALAPECELQAIRASNTSGNLVAAMAGFLRAKALGPRILTNSWGGDMELSAALTPGDRATALELQDAVESGIFVVFSAGNGHFSVEPQVPEVFAAGGVFMDGSMNLQASSYASGYRSPFFAGRIVPDACGLVGMLPRADYIMLPVQPACELDVEMSHLDERGNPGDGTTTGDGWARFSGTSAAAPQIAGVAAAILSAKPALTPAQVKQCITATAVDVRTGHCHPRFNNPAGPGQDDATGFGLANAGAAVQFALDNF